MAAPALMLLEKGGATDAPDDCPDDQILLIEGDAVCPPPPDAKLMLFVCLLILWCTCPEI